MYPRSTYPQTVISPSRVIRPVQSGGSPGAAPPMPASFVPVIPASQPMRQASPTRVILPTTRQMSPPRSISPSSRPRTASVQDKINQFEDRPIEYTISIGTNSFKATASWTQFIGLCIGRFLLEKVFGVDAVKSVLINGKSQVDRVAPYIISPPVTHEYALLVVLPDGQFLFQFDRPGVLDGIQSAFRLFNVQDVLQIARWVKYGSSYLYKMGPNQPTISSTFPPM